MMTWLTTGIEGPLAAVLAISAVAGAVVLLRRWQHRAGDYRRATAESRADRREAEAVRRSLEDLLVEVEQTTARLDERIASRLRELESAEARIATRLAELDHTARPTVRAPSGVESSERGRRTPATPALHPTPVALPRSKAPLIARIACSVEPDARFEAIYALADAGNTPAAVADKTGMPLGEIETILGFRRLAATD